MGLFVNLVLEFILCRVVCCARKTGRLRSASMTGPHPARDSALELTNMMITVVLSLCFLSVDQCFVTFFLIIASLRNLFRYFSPFCPHEILIPQIYFMSLYTMRSTNNYDILSFFHTLRTSFYPLRGKSHLP